MIQAVGSSVVASDPDAVGFWQEEGLEDELEQALPLLLSAFPGTGRVHFLVLEEPDEEESRSRLVAELGSPLPRKEFRKARMKFFEDLHNKGFEKVYDALTVLRE